jgi:hypothetical protein
VHGGLAAFFAATMSVRGQIDPFQVDNMRQNQLWIVGGVVLAFLLACFTLDLDKIKVEPVDRLREVSVPLITPK